MFVFSGFAVLDAFVFFVELLGFMFFFVFARFRDFCFLVVCRCFKFVDFWFYRVFGFLPFSFFLLFGSFAVSVSFGFLLDFCVFPYLGLLVNFRFLLVC